MGCVVVKWFGKLSIKYKLVLGFVLVSVIPIVIAMIVSTTISKNALTQDANDYNSIIVKQLSGEITTMLLERVHTLQALSDIAAIRSMDPTLQLEATKALQSKYTDIVRVNITDAKGQQIVTSVPGPLNNVSDRQYFKDVMSGKEFAVSDVMVAKATNQSIIMVSVPIKDSQGKIEGTLSSVIDLVSISKSVQEKKIGQSGIVYITDKNGIVLAHPDIELMKAQTDLTSIPSVKEALSKKEGTISYELNGKKLAAYTFIPLTNWAIIAEVPESQALTQAIMVQNIGIGMSLLVLVIALVIGFIFAGVFVKPINLFVKGAKSLAEGDLSSKIEITSKDELGQLGVAFEKMRDNLQSLIKDIKNNSEQLAASSEELTASAGQSANVANQVATTISTMANGVVQQHQASQEMTASIENLSLSIQVIATNTDSVSTSSRMAVGVAKDGRKVIEKAIDQMERVKNTVNNSAEVVAVLGTRSKEISNIIGVITSIAGQTNLLALNAAIEAARAGEQGRGFAVVADEVRKLAEESGKAAKQIETLISEIQQETERAVNVMTVGTQEVKIGTDVVNEAGQSFENISQVIEGVVSQVNEIASAIQQISKNSHEVLTSVKVVDKINEDSAGQAETISAATQEQSASMEQIAASSNELVRMAENLQNSIRIFKLS